MSSNAGRHGGLGRWVVMGLGAFVFAVFAAVLWYAYVEVMGLGAGGPPPLIKAEAGPIKRAPDDPGGMEIPNRDSAAARVFQERGDGLRRERILPRQDTSQLELEPEPPPPVERLEASEPTPHPPAEPSPAAGTPTAPPAQVETTPAVTPPPPAVRPQVVVTDRLGAATPQPTAPQPAAPQPATPTAQPPRPLAPPAGVLRPPTPAPVPQPPTQALPTSPPLAGRTPPAAVPPTRSAPAASPIFRVQLGAFRSEAAANQAWSSLQRRLQAPLASLRPFVLEAQTSAGTFYRLQAGPLSSRDGAVQTCSQVKAGGNDCFIVGPLP